MRNLVRGLRFLSKRTPSSLLPRNEFVVKVPFEGISIQPVFGGFGNKCPLTCRPSLFLVLVVTNLPINNNIRPSIFYCIFLSRHHTSYCNRAQYDTQDIVTIIILQRYYCCCQWNLYQQSSPNTNDTTLFQEIHEQRSLAEMQRRQVRRWWWDKCKFKHKNKKQCFNRQSLPESTDRQR